LAKRFLTHWRGIVLSLIGVVSIAWLALTDQLGLYIHPRYFVFTVIMAAFASLFVVLGFALLPESVNESHDHETAAKPARGDWWWVSAHVVLIAATTVGLLVLPPATLTTSTVAQRAINSSAPSSFENESIDLGVGDLSSLTVKDWAGLLRQGVVEDSFAGKAVTLVGFVTPDTDDPANVFYVARFTVTCCAVDAQPIGVPVYLPGWQDDFEVDGWVSVTGAFVSNPSTSSRQSVVLSPTEIIATEQPTQPYVY